MSRCELQWLAEFNLTGRGKILLGEGVGKISRVRLELRGDLKIYCGSEADGVE